MSSAEEEKHTPHSLEFRTGREVAQIDQDPVLERSDIWRGDQQ